MKYLHIVSTLKNVALAANVAQQWKIGGGPNMEALQSRLQVANQEVNRLREDMRRMQEFKRTVAEVFVGLNVQVPSGLPASTERIEEYVNELRSMIARTGPVNPRDQEQILDYVKKIV